MSCNSPKANNAVKTDVAVLSDTINAKKEEQSFVEKPVFGSDTIKRDTTINCFYVSYIIQDNDDIIETFPIVDGKGLDTVCYAGREIILDVKYKNENILQKKIKRDFFNSYIPKSEIDKYSIYYFKLNRVDKGNRMFFDISLCVPETDICYWFELSISNNGDIEIKDTTLDDDEEM